MKLTMVGYKCGMTRFFTQNGESIPVTLIKLYSNNIIGIRALNDNKYLIKIVAGKLNKKVIKPIEGIYKKYDLKPCRFMLEFKVNKNDIDKYKIGDELNISSFKESEKISITGISKGCGFSGVIKRHNFSAQRASHGNSLSHRVPGSIGQCQTPGKVFKGKKMPGRLGNNKITISNLKIIGIYNDLNTIIIKGAVPGPTGGKVILKNNFS